MGPIIRPCTIDEKFKDLVRLDQVDDPENIGLVHIWDSGNANDDDIRIFPIEVTRVTPHDTDEIIISLIPLSLKISVSREWLLARIGAKK